MHAKLTIRIETATVIESAALSVVPDGRVFTLRTQSHQTTHRTADVNLLLLYFRLIETVFLLRSACIKCVFVCVPVGSNQNIRKCLPNVFLFQFHCVCGRLCNLERRKIVNLH